MKAISTVNAPAAIGPYSQAIEIGDTIFTSGIIPIVPETGEIVGASVEAQANQVFTNLSNLLHDAGSSMENVIKTIREANPKRIVVVFGCGGNRSKQRRYDCGKIAGELADLSIVTADNPRYEDNNEIIEDILSTLKPTGGEYIVVPDRRDAIKYSIVNAKEGDVVMILGKGHEDYQEIKGVRYPFDERVVIREILDSLTEEEKKNL